MTAQETQRNITGTLARFAATLKYEEIPEHARKFSKNLLLDALACALAGRQGDETMQIEALASGLAQSKESSVIGGDHLSLAAATMLNGYLITAITICDVYRPAASHVTPEVVPPALAIAERDSLPGRDLLVALTAGFETMTRIGTGVHYPAFRKRGFHGPGVLGPFGAAASAGRLLGLNPETMATAFGLAGSQSGGTYAAIRTPTVKFHQCRAALSGLMAALLAQQGFVATREFLTAADGGLFNSFSDGGLPEAVIQDLGARWELEQISLKPWPSGSVIQGLITAMFDLIEGNRIGPNDVKKLHVFMSKSAVESHGKRSLPKGKFQALLSPHYSAAVILHDRELSLAQLEPGRYSDPKLTQFALEKVEVNIDPALIDAQARVEAETAGGSIITVHCRYPKGAPENPLSWEQVEGKFRTYARTRLPDSRVEEVIGLVSRLEDLASTRKLLDALRVV